MTSISRQLTPSLLRRMPDKKALIVLGARQVGKTHLITQLLEDSTEVIYFTGDSQRDQDLLRPYSTEQLASVVGDADVIFIDEAQRIDGIGLSAKMLIDQLKKKVILTGSSALELNKHIQESLTGRKWSFELFAFSWSEIRDHYGLLGARGRIPSLLVHGSYPDVVTADETDRVALLQDIYTSYLFKDIFALSGIRRPQFLEKLLKALSYQVGSEFSTQELSRTVGIDAKTVEQYIQLLEQAFIVFRLSTYKRNLRTELSTKQKIFFWDNGVRNAVIGDFTTYSVRQDKGALWENYLISQRIIRAQYLNNGARHYFWRTVRQQDIDLIEEIDGGISAYEIKSGHAKKVRFSRTFTEAYPDAHCEGILGQEGLEGFLS